MSPASPTLSEFERPIVEAGAPASGLLPVRA
jgi:hypothetical protein